jgi:hypothetical protein
MANVVEIIVKATDQTSGVLSDVSSYFGELKNSFDQLANNPVIQFLKDSIQYTIDYKDAVEDLSTKTGMTVEESSKLIQAASDFGVSYGDLMKGVEGATKNGTQVTVDELGKIANEYLALGMTDGPVGQAKFLIEKFGQAGADLAPMFAKGKNGVVTAMDGISEALVLDDGEFAKLDSYSEATKDFDDAIAGLKVTLGSEILPSLTTFFEEINKIVAKFDEFDSKFRIFQANMTTTGGLTLWNAERKENFVIPQIDYAEQLASYQQYRDYMSEILNIANLTADGYGAIRTRTGEAIDGVRILTEAEWEAKTGVDEIKKSYDTIPAVVKKTIIIDAGFTEAALLAMSLFGTGGAGKTYFGLTDEGETKRGPGGARGGTFTVPAGYPNDSFPMRVQSGEVVQVTPQGQHTNGDAMDYERLSSSIVDALVRSGYLR